MVLRVWSTEVRQRGDAETRQRPDRDQTVRLEGEKYDNTRNSPLSRPQSVGQDGTTILPTDQIMSCTKDTNNTSPGTRDKRGLSLT